VRPRVRHEKRFVTSAEMPPATRYGARAVAVAMALVVTCFSLTLAVSLWRTLPIDDLALEIMRDEAPSIEQLDSLRVDVQRLEVLVDEYAADRQDTASAKKIGTLRHQIDTGLEAFRRLPTTPEELAEVDAIEGKLSHLDEAMMQYESFRGYLDEIDAALLHLKAINTRDAGNRSSEILRARRSAMSLATILGVASWLIAVGASLLVMRNLRSHERLLKAHHRLISERSAELEAFTGRIAHDLKSPLAAMSMRVHLIARHAESNRDVSLNLNTLIQQLRRMGESIDGMLEFARAGAGPTPGVGAAVKAILDEVIEDVRPVAKAAGIEINVSPCPAVQLACTSAALTSILSNLLGNAVKYSADGATRPSIVSVRAQCRCNFLRIEVADTGPGLPPGAELVIFEPFRRLFDHPQPGIGLGLSTVKKIVEAYQGQVGVESTRGLGSVFWVDLPTLSDETPRFGRMNPASVRHEARDQSCSS
jgi:signal transduction histidine kinase